MSGKITFNDWCKKEHKEEFLDLWDYELNEITPDEIYVSDKNKYYFKCERGIHKSRLIRLASVTGNKVLNICRECISFGQWCIDNNRHDLLDRWDTDLNEKSPFEVGSNSKYKCYLSCPRGIHESEQFLVYNLVNHNTKFICKKCNSFAQFGIDKYGEDFLKEYWSDKNILDPWDISRCSATKIWIKCINYIDHLDF